MSWAKLEAASIAKISKRPSQGMDGSLFLIYHVVMKFQGREITKGKFYRVTRHYFVILQLTVNDM